MLEHKQHRPKRLPSNWRNRIEITTKTNECCAARFSYPTTTFTVTFKKGQTPKGFYRQIGDLTISTGIGKDIKPPYRIDDVFITRRMRRRGLGILLYTHALHHFGSLTTQYHSASNAAQRVWQSLVRKFHWETDFFKDDLTVFARTKRGKQSYERP